MEYAPNVLEGFAIGFILYFAVKGFHSMFSRS